jgi:hypothetical protein
MKATPCLFLLLALSLSGAQAQTTPTVSKDCKDLKEQARAECLKVARQMEKEAAKPGDPANTAPTSNGPSADSIHHSSPVMQTPQEKKEAAKTAPPNPPK